MCVPFRLASVVLPLPAPPPWLVCCLQCVWGACVPRKRGVPGWPGAASEILHSGTHLPSSKASVPRRKDQQKEGLPSLHSHSATASVGQHLHPSPFRLSLSQGMPQLRHTPATARQGCGGRGPRTHFRPSPGPSPGSLPSLAKLQAITSFSFYPRAGGKGMAPKDLVWHPLWLRLEKSSRYLAVYDPRALRFYY